MTGQYTPPPDTGLQLWHVDAALLVVEKPSGLLAVPGRGADKQDCLLRRVQVRFPDALAVHRLDMETSGLMVFARGKAMERALSILFQSRQVHKKYIAVVAGKPDPTTGTLAWPLLADWPNRPRQKIDLLHGKPALTHYRMLSYDPATDTARLELEPVTGRSHQLRVHLQALGHPILGDALYGGSHYLRAPRLLLHACNLSFPHPQTGLAASFNSTPPF